MSYRILVVDDESNILDVCSRYLEREGYEVLTAANGEGFYVYAPKQKGNVKAQLGYIGRTLETDSRPE